MKQNTDCLIRDINEPQAHHRALTGFLRRKWSRNPYTLKRIVYNTDVSQYIGALPPELRSRVPREQIATVTAQFREHLENFLIQNIFDLREMKADHTYELPQIGNLFGTKCTLFARGINVDGMNPWAGLLGFVCKMSFPEIDAHYALKLFYGNVPNEMYFSHGIWFEVGTALAANKAEAKDNVPMYMASLKYEKYMLSQWAGDTDDGAQMRPNQHKIFYTRTDEDGARNRRMGRRIDWGETYMTNYGALSYRARKAYRQALNMDRGALQKSIDNARNVPDRRDLAQALKLAELVAWHEENQRLSQWLDTIQKQR